MNSLGNGIKSYTGGNRNLATAESNFELEQKSTKLTPLDKDPDS